VELPSQRNLYRLLEKLLAGLEVYGEAGEAHPGICRQFSLRSIGCIVGARTDSLSTAIRP
jgi:hypothetical protein